MKDTFEKMDNLFKSRYIDPGKIAEKKLQIDGDIGLEVEYFPIPILQNYSFNQ